MTESFEMWEQTLCAMWLRFQIRRDPRLALDNDTLLKEFATLHGLTVPELKAHFIEEEAEARDAAEARWWAKRTRSRQG
jgi:hypothetical protein